MRFGYTTTETAQLVGMTERQVRYLAAKDLVVPSVRRPDGRGTGARYALSDLMHLAVVQRLRASVGADLPFERVERILAALRKRAGSWTGTLLMVEEGCWVESGDISQALQTAQACVAVSLEAVERNLRLAINVAGMETDEAAAGPAPMARLAS